MTTKVGDTSTADEIDWRSQYDVGGVRTTEEYHFIRESRWALGG